MIISIHSRLRYWFRLALYSMGPGSVIRRFLARRETPKIHETVEKTRPDGWRGVQARENTIKSALLPVLGNDMDEVERIFPIIKAQREY